MPIYSTEGLLAGGPKSDDCFAGAYKQYDQGHSYDYRSGYLAMPVACADPCAEPKIIQVHAPLGIRTVGFSAQKGGRPPVVPAPSAESQNPASTTNNDFLLSAAVTVPMPTLSTDLNTFNYAVSGGYRFVQRCAPLPGSARIMTGKFPFYLGDEEKPTSLSTTSPTAPYFTTDYFSYFFDDTLINDSKTAGSGDYT